MPNPDYTGRFAPSPTGELHFGSLVAAMGSYLQARSRQGTWLIRIEDIDPPREVPGSAKIILSELGRLGMRADRPVLYQSTRMDAYNGACLALVEKGLAYACRCSRKVLRTDGTYPGHCRKLALDPAEVPQIRFRASDESIDFEDTVMGMNSQNLARAVGDFVIRRADGMPAYQLAVVVDDAHQEITEVVRGADLLDSTPRQIALQRALGLPTPGYCHLPLAVAADGSKLSKRAGTDPIGNARPETAISMALDFLGHTPPEGLNLDAIWFWAISHWDSDRIPRRRRLPAPVDVLPG